MTPPNKIATDQQILDALKEYDSRDLAAEALGIAKRTLYNRVSMMNKRGIHKEAVEQRPSNFKTEQNGKVRRYVVTCAMSNAPVDRQLLKILKQICEHEAAELVVIPQQYDWQDHLKGKQDAVYDSLVVDYLTTDDIKVNNHSVIKASYPLHATLVNPLQGLSMAAPEKSCIFGHPSRAFKTVATAQDKYPLLHYTSGAITKPRYTRSKTGQKSKDLHKMGAMFIEANDREFHCHELNYSVKHKNIQMLQHIYDGESCAVSSVESIVMGDEHAKQCSQETKNATYINDGCLVQVLKPKYVVRHDAYDHDADSHHTRKNTVQRFIRRIKDEGDVEKELELTVNHIDSTTSNFTNIIVGSNHNDHLDQWLNEFNPHSGDPINYPIYHYLNYLKFKSIKEGKFLGAFQLYCSEKLKNYDSTIWTSRNKDYKIKDIAINSHGDLGVNGARGGASLAMIGVKMIIGHCHSPYINKLVYAVGAQMMKAGYTNGYSGWLITNCAIYGNGERAMINIINGRWRLNG